LSQIQEIHVVKLTGKIFDEPELVKQYLSIFREIVGSGEKLVVVSGGGFIARRYIDYMKKLGVDSNYLLDMVGIHASRLNSYLIIYPLREYAYPKPAETLEELMKAIQFSKIVVLGGLIPGQSTAAVALEAAEAIGVHRVIDISAVDHVYDKNPLTHPDAKPFKEIKASDLINILKQEILPGEYALIDIHALMLAIRSKIVIQTTYYKEPEQLKQALRGENPGTTIYPE